MADSESRAEALLAWGAIGMSGVFLVEGAQLKPGVFEPIGPGAVPMGVAVITIVLGALVLIGRWRTRPPPGTPIGPADSGLDSPPDNWRLLLYASVCTLVYAAVLQAGLTRYGYATVAYLLVTSLLVAEHRRRALPWIVALSLGFGLGLDYVFRHLLVADLP